MVKTKVRVKQNVRKQDMFKPSTFDISQTIAFSELKSEFGVSCCDVDNQMIDLLTIAKHIEKYWVI